MPDLESILALRVALRTEEQPGSSDATEHLRELTSRQLQANDQVFWLAQSGGEVVGLVRCAIQAPPAPALHAATLTTAYVRPDFRRQHVMRTLVDAAQHWCVAQGVPTLRLRNGHHNAVANATWEALGFAVVQVVRQRTLER